MPFPYIDELVIIVLGIMSINKKTRNYKKELADILLFFIFYLCYSLYIKTNIWQANIADFFQQLKPYLSFLFCARMNISLSNKQKKYMHDICFYILLFIFILYLLLDWKTYIWGLFTHPGPFGNLVYILSLTMFFFSKKKGKDIVWLLLFLLWGVLCGRSKYYGSIVVFLFLLFFLKDKIVINMKNVTYMFFVSIIVIYVIWEKFTIYFIYGLSDESNCRVLLYKTSFLLLSDYFPFGSGLGSFGVDASRVYYSPIYDKYGLSNIWGMSREKSNFITDTFFPVLIGQFGLLGIWIFVSFIRKRIDEIKKALKTTLNIKQYCCTLSIIITIIFESVAGPLFVAPMGVLYMITLALLIKNSYE